MNGGFPTRLKPAMWAPGLRMDLPLARGLVMACPFWGGAGGVRGLLGRNGAPTGGAWGIGKGGPQRLHAAITDKVDFGPADKILPTGDCTVVLHYQKTDATLRDHGAFGVNDLSTNTYCSATLPWSDGVAYWEYGGNTGANHVAVSGLTFGDDLWVFTAGKRGAELWQNGILRGSTAGAITRNSTSGSFMLGLYSANIGSTNSDLAAYKLLLVYSRQLSAGEVRAISDQPYQLFTQPKARVYIPEPAIGGSVWRGGSVLGGVSSGVLAGVM